MAHLVHGFNRRFLHANQNQPLLQHKDGEEPESEENGLFASDSKGILALTYCSLSSSLG